MPLSAEQISERRTMSADASRDQDIFRIAEALETIAESLDKIQEQLFQNAAAARLPGGSSYTR